MTETKKDEKPAVVIRTDEHFTARFLCGAHIKRYITLVDRYSGLQVTGKLQTVDHKRSGDVTMWVHEDEDTTRMGHMTLYDASNLFNVHADDEVTIHGIDPRMGR